MRAARSCTFSGGSGARAAGGMIIAPQWGFRGAPPDTPLVTFVVKRKSPGCRAWQSHALAERLQVGAGTAVPQKPPGRGAERPPSGAVGAKPPKKLPGVHPPAVEREKRGAQRGQHLWCTPSHGGEKPRAAHPLAWERSRAQRTPCEKAGVLSKFTICLSASSICVI